MNNLIANFISIIFIPYDILTNWKLLSYYITVVLIIIGLYLIVMYIYCRIIFNIDYSKFIKATLFPIVGMIILIIQGIIYIFFIPYNIVLVIKDTFTYIFQIISILFNWLYNFIKTILNIESYLLYE